MSKKKRKKKHVKKPKKDSKFKYVVFILLFTISWAPLLFSVLMPTQVANVDFSVYNTSGTGISSFKEDIESMGYTVKTLYSSLSTLNKYKNSAVLMIIGPSKPYDPLDTVALINFVLNGGCVLIADDFGSANTLLSLFTQVGFTIQFGPGVIVDIGSPYNNSPLLPLITNFIDSPLTRGVSRIVLNYATFINATLPPYATTSRFSWADLDNDTYPDPENETAGPFTVLSAIDFSEFIENAGRIVLLSDPSLFINYMIDIEDNRILARNIVTWLSRDGEIDTIIFDEGHLSYPPWTSIYFFSLIMSNVTFLSSNWLLAPLFPIFTFYLAKRWLPKPKKEIKFSLKEIFRRRGVTEFSALMTRIKETETYSFALKILITKWKNDLKSIFKKPIYSFQSLLPIIESYDLKNIDKKKLRKAFKLLDKKKIGYISKSDLSEIFFVMDSFINLLRGGKSGRK